MGLVFKAIILAHPRIIHVRGCQGHGRGQRLMDWSAGCAPVKEKLRLEKMSDTFECSITQLQFLKGKEYHFSLLYIS